MNKLDSFYNYVMTNTWILIDIYYAFYKRPNISSYVMDLLYKDKVLCDKIKNISNRKSWSWKSCL